MGLCRVGVLANGCVDEISLSPGTGVPLVEAVQAVQAVRVVLVVQEGEICRFSGSPVLRAVCVRAPSGWRDWEYWSSGLWERRTLSRPALEPLRCLSLRKTRRPGDPRVEDQEARRPRRQWVEDPELCKTGHKDERLGGRVLRERSTPP
ncbi:unnamed protein product [Arctogadus glacialis]